MEWLKKDFPLLLKKQNGTSLCYLDNASTTQKPQIVIDAIAQAYSSWNANPGRGIYRLAEEATQRYERARETVAQFIGAQSHEIVFVPNATAGINAVAQGWARYHLKAGDEILCSELEHHSNLLPWQRIAREKGALLRFIPVAADGLLDEKSVSQFLTKRTKLVAITHRSNAIGTSVDVASIIQHAKNVGAYVLIDACQSVPHMEVNVRILGCDFLVFAGHKMLGPTGIGVLYINERIIEEITPFMVGGGSVINVSWQEHVLKKAPHRFEAGTPPYIEAMGLAVAIKYLKTHVLCNELARYEATLCRRLIDGLVQIDGITVLGSKQKLKNEGTLVTFVIDGIHAHDVAAYLDTRGICVRAGHFCAQPLIQKLGYDAAVRASFYCYNQVEDVDQLLEALDELKK